MKTFAIGSVLVLVIGACAAPIQIFRAPDPHTPIVTVAAGGYVVVDQEPIVIPKEEKDTLITWQLPPDSGYNFPDNGIVIAGGAEEFTCSVGEGRKRFVCRNRHSRPGVYKYTIRVRESGPGSMRDLDPLDPYIRNG